MVGRTNASAGKAAMPPLPLYTGTMNVVYLTDDGMSGYAEFTSSGTLTWQNDFVPEGIKFDLFCVGGGASTSGSGGSTNYVGRAGAGSGYTHTEKGVGLPERIEITIGAGGSAGAGTSSSGNRGGTTSIGELCSAEGGYGNSGTAGGNGGSGGARPGADSGSEANRTGGNGGSNGSDATGGTTGSNGKGQGTPTTDLLGRVHAGGGGGAKSYNPVSGGTNGQPGKGGASDFAAGKGADSGDASGGGGYGGGAAGTRPNNNGYSSGYAGAAGGQGFAMIAWGDYKELYNRTAELEYIESTGTQYINTGLSMPNGFVAKMKVCMTVTSANAQAVIGAIDDSSPYNRNYFTALQNLSRWNVGAYDDLACGDAISVGEDYELEISTVHGNVYCKVDGVAQSIGTPSAASRSAKNIYLFDVNYPYPMPAHMRMYYCQIFDPDGNLVRDYVPAVRVRDNTAGMLDKANDVFYSSAGTGAFLGKRIMDNAKFTQVEYIQSSGTQYIDTGFTPNQETRVYAECVFPTSSTTQALFGSRTSSSANQFQFVSSGNYYRSDYNTTASNVTNVSYGSNKFYVDKAKNVFDLNGDHSLTQTYAAFTCPGSMYIFATNNNGAVYAQTSAKLYALRVYDNGALVRDFTPVKRVSDGIIGLWDAITGELFTNAGTGTFVAGSEV